MQLKQSNKFIILASIFIIAVSNSITYVTATNKNMEHDLAENITESMEEITKELVEEPPEDGAEDLQPRCPDYIVSAMHAYRNETSQTRFLVMQVVELEDFDLFHKINQNIEAVFIKWMPVFFEYVTYLNTESMMDTNQYLSIRNRYLSEGKRIEVFPICNTINMETGDVMYLDDFIVVNEELAQLILTKGITKLDTVGLLDRYDYEFTQEELDRHNTEEVLKKLYKCSEPYNENNYWYKPTFYLRYGRLYFVSVFSEQTVFYIELEKIEHLLKVDKW